MTTSDRWPKDKIRYDLSVYFPSLELTCVTPGKTDFKTMSNHTRVIFPNIYTGKAAHLQSIFLHSYSM